MHNLRRHPNAFADFIYAENHERFDGQSPVVTRIVDHCAKDCHGPDTHADARDALVLTPCTRTPLGRRRGRGSVLADEDLRGAATRAGAAAGVEWLVVSHVLASGAVRLQALHGGPSARRV